MWILVKNHFELQVRISKLAALEFSFLVQILIWVLLSEFSFGFLSISCSDSRSNSFYKFSFEFSFEPSSPTTFFRSLYSFSDSSSMCTLARSLSSLDGVSLIHNGPEQRCSTNFVTRCCLFVHRNCELIMKSECVYLNLETNFKNRHALS